MKSFEFQRELRFLEGGALPKPWAKEGKNMGTARKQNKLRTEIDKIKTQLLEKYKPESIILFGSANDGKFKKLQSDIDLCVIKDDVPERSLERMREVRKLVKSDLPMDILVFKPEEIEEGQKLGDPFILHILNKGTRLYG